MLIWMLKHTNIVSRKEPKAWMIRTKYEIAHSFFDENQSEQPSFIFIVTK